MTDRERIFEYVRNNYGVTEDYPFPTDPGIPVMRHQDTGKWFAIIMEIPKKRLGLDEEGITDIMNLRIKDPVFFDFLVSQKGYFPGYHMNHNNWISVMLDGTVSFEKICHLIDKSFEATDKKKKIKKSENTDVKTIDRFVAFDVETPNRYNNRMSAIGITVIENGKITDEFYTMVDPETSFDYFNTQLTGLDEDTVRYSPTFPEIWPRLESYFSRGLIVAHNAVFDLSVIKHCLKDYGICWRPYVRYICTVQTGRAFLPGIGHKLNEMCDYYGIELNHHVASSDSRACAKILLKYIEGGADVKNYIRTYKLTDGN